MSRPDAKDVAERFAASPLLPQDDGGPVFAEPWQAQAFAMAVQLSADGHFTWTEWTTALGEQLQAAVKPRPWVRAQRVNDQMGRNPK